MVVKVAMTEPCPNCDLFISKQGGCQYMRCPKCTYEFCWFCLGNAPGHQHEIGTNCSPRVLAMYTPTLLILILFSIKPTLFILKPLFAALSLIFSYILWLVYIIKPVCLQSTLFYTVKFPNKTMETSIIDYRGGLKSKTTSFISFLASIICQILILGFLNQVI